MLKKLSFLKSFFLIIILCTSSIFCYNELSIGNTPKQDLLQVIRVAEGTKKQDYIKKSKRVDIINSFPNLKFMDSKCIKYAVYYNDGITNYYSDKGKLVLRTYSNKEKIIRYQKLDKENNFYTYDDKQNLVEYSKDLNVYDSENKIIYTSKTLNNKTKKRDKSCAAKISKIKLANKLNHSRSHLSKSICKMLDNTYGKISNEEMANELTEYFKELKTIDPKLYKYWSDVLYYNRYFTLNIGKTDNHYVFAINGVNTKGIQNTKASLAETINIFNGECAEIALKTSVKHKLDQQYFYDIKFKYNHGNIKCYPHLPCSTCRVNTSLWSWKYPRSYK